MRKIYILFFLTILFMSILLLPAIVCLATGQPDKFQYYVQALDYLLKGLIEYFKAVVELFKTAVS